MNKYINHALELTEKSMVRNHQHGAVCVIGGKIISCGININSCCHVIKIGNNKYKLRAFYSC